MRIIMLALLMCAGCEHYVPGHRAEFLRGKGVSALELAGGDDYKTYEGTVVKAWGDTALVVFTSCRLHIDDGGGIECAH